MKPNTLPRRMSPLWVIASFVSVTETVAGVSLNFTAGHVQCVLTWFVVGYAVLVLACFFITLWVWPSKLYSPYDYPSKPGPIEMMASWGHKGEDHVSQEAIKQIAASVTEEAKSSTDSSTSRVEKIIEDGFSEMRRAEIEAKLSREIERLSFCDIDLADVFTFLREYSDVNLWVNWRALYEIGVESTTKMSVDVRKISVREALDRMFDDLNSTMPSDMGLVYAVRGNVVRITTTLALARERERERTDVSE
jgi:hypothetical protein